MLSNSQRAALAADLDHILAHTEGLWEELRGQRVFITGGTGFFGRWLLESFAWANEKLRLRAETVVLSRNPAAFRAKAPHLAANPSIRFQAGDVRTFEFPPGDFSRVIHAATESSTAMSDSDPLRMFDTIVIGTRRVLDFAVQARARSFLLTSSGAVYGKQPPELTHLAEDHPGAPCPLTPSSAYGEGKRVAELLCALYHRQHGVETKIARCFAFVGPWLPLDAHFAIGNFIRDALRGGPIEVKGDGTPRRSYLYAADLAVWLWTILLRGQTGRPYHVGGDQEVTIGQLANEVRDVVRSSAEIQIRDHPLSTEPLQRYVPSTARARNELGLTATIPLSEAIRRTAAWYAGQFNPAAEGREQKQMKTRKEISHARN
jgi:nucleoside-diphosphate-sugar epimerase